MELLLILVSIAVLFETTSTYRVARPLRTWESDPLPGELDPPLMTVEGERLVGGDMIPNKRQIQKYRTARTFPMLYWPNAQIPFAFNSTSEPDRPVIQQALMEWQKHTCIKFTEVAENAPFPHLIFKKLFGCNSFVGMDRSQAGQKISIGLGCNKFGVIVHEVGHAIGFHHEQSRPDRERFLQLRLENTNSTHYSDFGIKFRVESYPEPYDYDSIMHYPGVAFSNNGQNTIVTLNPFKQVAIGQREFLSFYDAKAANSMYNCSAHCYQRPKCYNDGYVNKFCRCTCPPNHGGYSCETKYREKMECGGTYTKPVTIQIPKFSWETKDKIAKCVWWIKAPKHQYVEVIFQYFKISVPDPANGRCKWGSFEIRTNTKLDGKIYCGSMLQGKQIRSKGNEMIILYREMPQPDHRVVAHVRFKKNKQHHHKRRKRRYMQRYLYYK